MRQGSSCWLQRAAFGKLTTLIGKEESLYLQKNTVFFCFFFSLQQQSDTSIWNLSSKNGLMTDELQPNVVFNAQCKHIPISPDITPPSGSVWMCFRGLGRAGDSIDQWCMISYFLCCSLSIYICLRSYHTMVSTFTVLYIGYILGKQSENYTANNWLNWSIYWQLFSPKHIWNIQFLFVLSSDTGSMFWSQHCVIDKWFSGCKPRPPGTPSWVKQTQQFTKSISAFFSVYWGWKKKDVCAC